MTFVSGAVPEIYAEILVDRVRRVTEGLIDNEQGEEDFRLKKGCVDQIFTLKQICEKEREKKRRFMWILWI